MASLKQEKGFYKGIFLLMLPMIIQNIVSQSMAFADTFMVGLLGETQLAAVAAATTPFFVVMLACFGLQSGASILTSQYNGSGNTRVVNRILGISWMTAFSMTCIVALAASLMPMQLMEFLTNNTDLHAPGAEYVRIIGFSYIFFSISSMYTAVQRALGNPKLGAYIFTSSGLANVFLNWILIFGKFGAPAMGIRGAALATVISRMLEVAAVLIYMNRSKLFKPEYKLIFSPGKAITKDFFKIAMPVALNELLWSVGTSLLSIIMGHMPNSIAVLSAYTICGNIEKLLSVAIMAVGNASAIITGTEIGKGNQKTVQGKAVALNLLAFIVGLAASLLVLIVRQFVAVKFLFPAMGLGEEAQGIAMFMLAAMVFIQPFRSLNMANIVGVFRGGGDVFFAFIADVVPLWVLSIPAAALLGLTFSMGVVPVYLSITANEILKVVMTLPRLHSKKWIHDITREHV